MFGTTRGSNMTSNWCSSRWNFGLEWRTANCVVWLSSVDCDDGVLCAGQFIYWCILGKTKDQDYHQSPRPGGWSHGVLCYKKNIGIKQSSLKCLLNTNVILIWQDQSPVRVSHVGWGGEEAPPATHQDAGKLPWKNVTIIWLYRERAVSGSKYF